MITLTAMMNEVDEGKYRAADERVQLAIYDVVWDLSQRIPRRSPIPEDWQEG